MTSLSTNNQEKTMKETFLKFEYKYTMKKNKKETDLIKMVELANCMSLVNRKIVIDCAQSFESVGKFLALLNSICDVELVQSKEVNNEK